MSETAMKLQPLSAKMTRVRDHIAMHLDGIREAFRGDVKITVLVRSPGLPDADFVMTDDAIDEAIGMLRRRAASETTISVPADV